MISKQFLLCFACLAVISEALYYDTAFIPLSKIIWAREGTPQTSMTCEINKPGQRKIEFVKPVALCIKGMCKQVLLQRRKQVAVRAALDEFIAPYCHKGTPGRARFLCRQRLWIRFLQQ
jgi:hypothetical protein